MSKNNLRKVFIIFLTIIMCVLLSSCSGNSIVGTWKASTFGIPSTITFNSDGTISSASLGFSTSIPARYKVNGDKITLTMDNTAYGLSNTSTTSTFILKGDTLWMDGLEFTRIK